MEQLGEYLVRRLIGPVLACAAVAVAAFFVAVGIVGAVLMP